MILISLFSPASLGMEETSQIGVSEMQCKLQRGHLLPQEQSAGGWLTVSARRQSASRPSADPPQARLSEGGPAWPQGPGSHPRAEGGWAVSWSRARGK